MHDFKTFLEDKHASTYTGTDDNMPEDFDRWLSELDHEDWISYAEEWCASLMKNHNG